MNLLQSNHDLASIQNYLIQENVPLADKNWFKTGGPARFFAQPTTALEFQAALAFALTHTLEIFVLGQGANILISDDGFNGLVIQPHLKNICADSNNSNIATVTAGAGATMHDLITWCLDHHITGPEEFSGIPGTVGGSVYINLHYFEFLLSQFLVSATVIEKATGSLLKVDNSWFKFGYNASTLQNKNYYLIDATFTFAKATPLETAFARGRHAEIIRHRYHRYPHTNTCGSFFRNFYPHEVTLEQQGKKIIYIAYYLDKIGVKGSLAVGDAQVSHQHANMIVNRGKATSTDIIHVAQIMQQRVFEHFGIKPEPECQLIGFNQHIL